MLQSEHNMLQLHQRQRNQLNPHGFRDPDTISDTSRSIQIYFMPGHYDNQSAPYTTFNLIQQQAPSSLGQAMQTLISYF